MGGIVKLAIVLFLIFLFGPVILAAVIVLVKVAVIILAAYLLVMIAWALAKGLFKLIGLWRMAAQGRKNSMVDKV